MRQWRSDYDQMAEMFFGDPPSFDAVMAAAEGLQKDFNS
jgi:hypothetical protein